MSYPESCYRTPLRVQRALPNSLLQVLTNAVKAINTWGAWPTHKVDDDVLVALHDVVKIFRRKWYRVLPILMGKLTSPINFVFWRTTPPNTPSPGTIKSNEQTAHQTTNVAAAKQVTDFRVYKRILDNPNKIMCSRQDPLLFSSILISKCIMTVQTGVWNLS